MKKIWRQLSLISIMVAVLFSNGLVFATGGDVPTGTTGSSEDVFTNVRASVCQFAKAIKGPVGIAVGFLVLVAGLVAMQIANRDAIPMISRAVIGTALLLGASAAFTAIVTTNNCT